ncbi:hypothetical protein VPHK394_0065 [Vibrio phage K394]
MNDNQELKDHLSDQPCDYVKESSEIKCECGEYLHAKHKCVEKPIFKFPWAIVMLFVGVWIGFVLGVAR